MVGHLQVFVLSDWISVNQPIEYSETAKGLRWIIPHQKLPWKNNNASSLWPNHVYVMNKKFSKQLLSTKIVGNQTYPCSTNISCARSENFVPNPGVFLGEYNISMTKVPYGQALDTEEYFMYFLVSIDFYILIKRFRLRIIFVKMKNISCREANHYQPATLSRE